MCDPVQQVVYNKKMFPAVFLDRDGVLIENRSEYVREWSQVFIYPKTYLSLFRLHKAGYKIVIVTNQSAVGRGLLSIHTAEEINHRLVDLICENDGHVDRVYLCPHDPGDGCDCRKPKPGMILQAARELDLDLNRSWMIGDAWSDLLAAHAAGMQKLILVKTGRGNDQLLEPQPVVLHELQIADDLAGAVDILLSNHMNGD
jgi:D-glycero-D-manno-heptose 1,7-bisphosphate phosphatase